MKIRRFTYFDYPKIKDLVPYLTEEDTRKIFIQEPAGILNSVLPIALKFKPDSYVLVKNGEITGLITVAKTPGNWQKINITRLILKENMYDDAKYLLSYIIKKYGQAGVKTFLVSIDECHDELFELFVNGCGFRQCSCEKLYKIEKPTPKKGEFQWRYAQNSDSQNISQLYNSELISIYSPSLLRNPKEFCEPVFSGFCDCYKTRFVFDTDGKILGYFSITTNDNLNYVLDITVNSGYQFDYEQIINDLLCEIARKKRAFYPLIKVKKYIKNAEDFENYLISKKYNSVQTRHILVKDFYREIKQSAQEGNSILLGENQIST